MDMAHERDSSSEEEVMAGDLRRGPWTVEEDILLVNYIAAHGEGRWNSLARSAGRIIALHSPIHACMLVFLSSASYSVVDWLLASFCFRET
ncbi:unnamed protein product [Triticum turgidum subsp. durum]|uniref:Uncharacterized protein n=1 Tax=Triticum turgidum subsp. durum TaxID=4567 RepID=A0A9R0WDI7_TRITD|nr:unnamed protein product [Triticum turgidum subsp. durum]